MHDGFNAAYRKRILEADLERSLVYAIKMDFIIGRLIPRGRFLGSYGVAWRWSNCPKVTGKVGWT